MNRSASFFSAASIVLALFVCGCSGSQGPERQSGSVSGTVTLDGQPLTAGVVKFSAVKSGNAAVVPVDLEERFKVDEMIVDTYSVTIDPPDPVPGEPGESKTPTTPVEIPPRYREAKTSGFQVDVKSGTNTFEFKMMK